MSVCDAGGGSRTHPASKFHTWQRDRQDGIGVEWFLDSRWGMKETVSPYVLLLLLASLRLACTSECGAHEIASDQTATC